MLSIGPRRKSAVVALRRAEWNVQIHPERLGFNHDGNLTAVQWTEPKSDVVLARRASGRLPSGSGRRAQCGHCPIGTGSTEEDVEGGEPIADLIHRDVKHRGDSARIVAANCDHVTVEVLALHLNEPQVPRKHLKRRPAQLQQLRHINRELFVHWRFGRSSFDSGDFTRQKLIDRDVVELG